MFGAVDEHVPPSMASEVMQVTTESTSFEGGFTVSEGDCFSNEGDYGCGTKCIDPVSGDTVSPIYHFTVD
jgi:hypothetical protein